MIRLVAIAPIDDYLGRSYSVDEEFEAHKGDAHMLVSSLKAVPKDQDLTQPPSDPPKRGRYLRRDLRVNDK